MAPAAYLQQYRGQGAGQATTGAEIVPTMKDATVSTTSATVKPSSSAKSPVTHSHSAALASPPTSPDPHSPSSMTANVSYSENGHTHSVTSPGDTQKSLAMASLASSLMAGQSGSQPVSHTPPTPAPKPASSSAAATAALSGEKQKFAPTWHSQAKSHMDDERKFDDTCCGTLVRLQDQLIGRNLSW